MMNLVMRRLYDADVWLRPDHAKEVAHGLQQVIRAYMMQAHLAHAQGESMFSCIPKVHALHEIWSELTRQIELEVSWVFNPVVETCSVDEDFVGRCAVLTRNVSPRLTSVRSLQRYKAQINVLWAHA